MRFNHDHVPNRFTEISEILHMQNSDELLNWFGELPQKLGLPSGLQSQKVSLTDELIQSALNDPCHSNNPVPCKREDFISVFEKSM